MCNLPFIRSITILFFMALLTGCASVNRISLDKNTNAKLTSVESKILIPGDEIIVRAQPSQLAAGLGGQGGLIGALIAAHIDGSVSASRQTALESIANPFYEKTDSIDFRTLFGDTFKAAIGDQKTLPGLGMTVSTRGLSKTTLEQKRVKLNPGEAFLGLRIWYEFNPDMRSVIVLTDAIMVASGSAEPVYRNSFLYASKPIDGQNPLVAWSENDGKALAGVFAESAKEIAYMFKKDLEAPSNEILFADLAKQQKIKVNIPFFARISANGFLIEEKDERKIVRTEAGALYSISK